MENNNQIFFQQENNQNIIRDVVYTPVINQNISTNVLPTVSGLIKSFASFYRTETNSNVNITIPLGINDGIFYSSSDIYLPNGIFTKTFPNIIISYVNNVDVKVTQNFNCMHDILIQYKITKSDGTNYKNRREIRSTLVNGSGNIYENVIFANQQPNTGDHDMIILKGYIVHSVGDIVKIKFNIVQDNKFGDQSDSMITIFRVMWNIL